MEQSVAGKKLLIMGGRPAATPDIVRAAKRMGVYTIVTDNVPPERSPAKLMADEYWDISTAEVDAQSVHRHHWVKLAVEWLNDTFGFSVC